MTSFKGVCFSPTPFSLTFFFNLTLFCFPFTKKKTQKRIKDFFYFYFIFIKYCAAANRCRRVRSHGNECFGTEYFTPHLGSQAWIFSQLQRETKPWTEAERRETRRKLNLECLSQCYGGQARVAEAWQTFSYRSIMARLCAVTG